MATNTWDENYLNGKAKRERIDDKKAVAVCWDSSKRSADCKESELMIIICHKLKTSFWEKF